MKKNLMTTLLVLQLFAVAACYAADFKDKVCLFAFKDGWSRDVKDELEGVAASVEFLHDEHRGFLPYIPTYIKPSDAVLGMVEEQAWNANLGSLGPELIVSEDGESFQVLCWSKSGQGAQIVVQGGSSLFGMSISAHFKKDFKVRREPGPSQYTLHYDDAIVEAVFVRMASSSSDEPTVD